MFEIIVGAGSLVLVGLGILTVMVKYGRMQQKVCDCDKEIEATEARLRKVEKEVITRDTLDGKFETVHRKIEEQGKEFMKEVGDLKLSVGSIDGTMKALLVAISENGNKSGVKTGE